MLGNQTLFEQLLYLSIWLEVKRDEEVKPLFDELVVLLDSDEVILVG